MKDYYAALELTPSASLKEIHSKYKELVNKLRVSADFNPLERARLSAIYEAYEVLKNPLSKRKYDVVIKNDASSSKKIRKNFSDIQLNRYEKKIEKKAKRGKLKGEKLLEKPRNTWASNSGFGDFLHAIGGVLELVLNIFAAFSD